VKQKLLDALNAAVALYESGLYFPEETWERIDDGILYAAEDYLGVDLGIGYMPRFDNWAGLRTMIEEHVDDAE
jgi:hypothetical protein